MCLIVFFFFLILIFILLGFLHMVFPLPAIDFYYLLLGSCQHGFEMREHRGRGADLCFHDGLSALGKHCMPVSLQWYFSLQYLLCVADRLCLLSLVLLRENVLLSSKVKRLPNVLLQFLHPKLSPPIVLEFLLLFFFCSSLSHNGSHLCPGATVFAAPSRQPRAFEQQTRWVWMELCAFPLIVAVSSSRFTPPNEALCSLPFCSQPNK